IAGAVEELAGIMRYSLETLASEGKVLLQLELDNVQRYIRIMRFRYDDRLQLDFNTDLQDSISDYHIPPHLLMTFVENVAKHGNLFDSVMPARINIKVLDGVLELVTENRIMNTTTTDGTHIGLENAK